MDVKERILAISILEKAKERPDYFKKLGVTAEMIRNKDNNTFDHKEANMTAAECK